MATLGALSARSSARRRGNFTLQARDGYRHPLRALLLLRGYSDAWAITTRTLALPIVVRRHA